MPRRHHNKKSTGTTSATFEAALAEQRRKQHAVSSSQPVTAAASTTKHPTSIPGFLYDEKTDRYYPASSSSSSSVNAPNKATTNHANENDRRRTTSINCISTLYARAISTHSESRRYVKEMYARKAASKLHLRATSLVTTTEFQTEPTVHPVSGVARTLFHDSGIGISPLPDMDVVRCVHRCNDSHGILSHPQWRPYTTADQPPMLAVVGDEPKCETLILHGGTTHLGGGAWRVLMKVSIESTNDRVHKLKWDDDGEALYLLGEGGIYRSRVSTSQHRVCLVLSTRRHNGTSVPCAVGNAPHSNSVLFVGYRNGTLTSFDLRENNRSSGADKTIGHLPFRVDHLTCLGDGVTLVAQDITGELSLFDIRINNTSRPNTSGQQTGRRDGQGRSGGELLCITEGRPNCMQAVRQFWTSPDESCVVAPYKQYETSGLAVWNVSTLGLLDHWQPDHNNRLLYFAPAPVASPIDSRLASTNGGGVVVAPNDQLRRYYDSHRPTTLFPALVCSSTSKISTNILFFASQFI